MGEGMLILNMYTPDSIDCYSLALREAGFEVIDTTNAFDALAIIRARRPVVAIVSTPMPEMSLDEFYFWVKANPATASTIILRAGRDEPEFTADGDLSSLSELPGAMASLATELATE